jgi:hypothetical protein
MALLVALVVLGFAGLGWWGWRMEKRSRARAYDVQVLISEAHRNLQILMPPDVSTRIEELHALIVPLTAINVVLARQEKSLELLPAGLKAVVDQVEAAFQRFEEHAGLPEEARDIAPVVMSRIERARQAMEKASADSLEALNAHIERGGREPRLRARGDE